MELRSPFADAEAPQMQPVGAFMQASPSDREQLVPGRPPNYNMPTFHTAIMFLKFVGVIALIILAGIGLRILVKTYHNTQDACSATVNSASSVQGASDCAPMNGIPAEGILVSANGVCYSLSRDVSWQPSASSGAAITVSGARGFELRLNGYKITVPAGAYSAVRLADGASRVYLHDGLLSAAANTASTSSRLIDITNASDVLIERIDFALANRHVQVTGAGVNGVSIRGCIFHDSSNAAAGIFGSALDTFGNTTNLLVENCRFRGNTLVLPEYEYNGRDVRIGAAAGTSVTNAVFRRNQFATGRLIVAAAGGARNVRIEDSEFYADRPGYVAHFIALQGNAPAPENVEIVRNIFTAGPDSPYLDAVEVFAVRGLLFEGNSISSNSVGFTSAYGVYEAASLHLGYYRTGGSSANAVQGVSVRNNRFLGGARSSSVPRSFRAIAVEALSSAVSIEYNRISSFDSGNLPEEPTGDTPHVGCIYVDASASNVQIRRNLISDITPSKYQNASGVAVYLAGASSGLFAGSKDCTGCTVTENTATGVVGVAFVDQAASGNNIVQDNIVQQTGGPSGAFGPVTISDVVTSFEKEAEDDNLAL